MYVYNLLLYLCLRQNRVTSEKFSNFDCDIRYFTRLAPIFLCRLGFGHYHQALKNAEHALFAAKESESESILIEAGGNITFLGLAVLYESVKFVLDIFGGINLLKADEIPITYSNFSEEDLKLFPEEEAKEMSYNINIKKLDMIRDFNTFINEYKKYKNLPCIEIEDLESLSRVVLADLIYRASMLLGENAKEKDILQKAYDISKAERKVLSVEVSPPSFDSISWAAGAGFLNDRDNLNILIQEIKNEKK